MLNPDEKEALYEIIVAVIGEDLSIKAYKSGFNEKTVLVVEEMTDANARCNKNMRELVTDFPGASTLMTRG